MGEKANLTCQFFLNKILEFLIAEKIIKCKKLKLKKIQGAPKNDKIKKTKKMKVYPL